MIGLILLVIGIALLLWLLFLAKQEKQFFHIMLWAFIFRFVLLLVDYLQIIILPGSGADSEVFHQIAVDNQASSEIEFYTNYEVFLTALYAITDCSRLFAQYLNLIMGLFTIYWLNKAMIIAQIDSIIRYKCLKCLAFLPNVAIFSVILLREAWIELFICISVYYFVKWFNERKGYKNLAASFACVIAASWMHEGCIALLLGYMICTFVYDRRTTCVHFSRYSIVALGVIALISIVLIIYADAFFGKLGQFVGLSSGEVMESVMGISESVEAESTYLTWLSYSNPVHLILFVPLKMFYFLYSPIPFDWRGIMDVIAFLMDSLIYLFLSYKIVMTSIPNKRIRNLRAFLLVAFLITTFMFSMGTIAAGTAIRHRAKILSILLFCYGLTMTYRNYYFHQTRK